ncbi:hypothetical protein JG688_00009926 [Phytophthora aleatoria]|uniref:Tr-type G domain-containing protein n=1 Tax=Phytophthora aleatoria TaxID=2496075 RepID=A0A8J5IFF8_9STRA|nr:hypothetical protein JG688_00009926 [Phytophthora aleatoria]
MSVVNVNVGVLGHVDSGKTSLVRALSTQLSTAALDKHPQSQQRGITLDLGFSSFCLEPSEQEKPSLQVTLVDCPGHASLFRTILGGVAIIDTVLLVVDCRKGLQAQTIESLLLASLIAQRRVIVALTKTDLLPAVDSERSQAIDAVTQEIRTFLATHFNFQNEIPIPVVPVAVGAGQEPHGIQQLLEALSANLQEAKDAVGSRVRCINDDREDADEGTIEKPFGKAGKVRYIDQERFWDPRMRATSSDTTGRFAQAVAHYTNAIKRDLSSQRHLQNLGIMAKIEKLIALDVVAI